MYQETVTGFDELPLDGVHPGTYFGDAVCGENSRTEGILDNSMSTSPQTWGKPLSDSDSGESLFLTQRDTQPVRTLKRQRPEQNALNQFAAGELHSEDEESDSPDRQWETSSQPRRTRKFSQLRWRRHSHKRLSRRKSSTCELGALGGFFKCVMKMKAEGFKVSKRPRKRPCQDTRRCISPPSDFGEGENCENDDIKIVDLKDLIPGYKIARKGYNPWLDGNDALGTVAEEMKDSSETTPDFSDPCSESSGSDREASSWEDECSESESESRPVRRPSSDRLSGCVTDALASCFRQDEMQQKGNRASVPETSPGVKKLRAMRKDTVKKQCVAGKRPPYTTMIQADVNEKEGRTEHLRLWDSPVMQLLDPGDGGNSQAKETGGEEGSPREATSRRDREGDNREQRRGAIENCAGGKNKIFPVPMRTWGAWEDEETNVNLQGCVHEETVTVPDSVQVDTEDGETDAVEDTVQSVTEGQPAGLLREDEQSKGTEIADEEPVGLPSDSVPAEEGTAGCAGEPEPHTQPSRDCQHQTQVRESCSSAGERERTLFDISIPEHVGESASGDITCEEGISKRKKKKRKKEKDDQENVEEHINEPLSETLSGSLHPTQDMERNSGVGAGECSVLVSGVSEPVGASGDVIAEDGGRKKKKKKRKKDDGGNVEEHVSEPTSETLSDSINLMHDKEKDSGAGVGEHSILISNIPEPVGDSASGEEGMKKKKKKREKKSESCANVEEEVGKPQSHKLEDSVHQTKYKEKSSTADIDGHSLLKSSISEAVGDFASGDNISEEGISNRKKKKRKKEKADSEHVNEPPSETLSGSLHLTQGKERNSGVGAGECCTLSSGVSEPVGDVICEEGISKRKKNKRKKMNESENVEEHTNEAPSETLSDSIHLMHDKDNNSEAGVGEHSLLSSNIPEPVGDSASGDVICEEGMRKKKKKKRKKEKDDQENVEELSEPVGDSASGDVICEEGMRQKKKKTRMKDTDDNLNVEEHGNEALSETFSDSPCFTPDIERSSGAGVGGEHSICNIPEPVGDSVSGDVICEEEMRKKKKKKRKKDNNGNVEEHVSELPTYTRNESQPRAQDEDGRAGGGEYFSSQEPVNDAASGDVICEGGIRKKKRKRDG